MTLIKKVFGKKSFTETIDVNFNEFKYTESVATSSFITVEEFMKYYNNIFYDIPKTGDNSHTYLVNQSLGYLDVSLDDLRNEIEILRSENVGLKNQILTITKISGSV